MEQVQVIVAGASTLSIAAGSARAPALDAMFMDDRKRREAANGRACALAMALHPRLGADSPLRALTPDLLSRIALLARIQVTKFVSAITVRTGLLVDCIAFHYSDGSSLTCGGRGGQERPFFRLSPGEYITKINGRVGDHLDAVQFETSFGRVSAMYGGSGGVPFEWAPPADSEIYAVAAAPMMRPKSWLTRIQTLARVAPRREWAEDIAAMRLHGFAMQMSFISHPARYASDEALG